MSMLKEGIHSHTFQKVDELLMFRYLNEEDPHLQLIN